MRLSRFVVILAALAVPAALASGGCSLVLDNFEKIAGAADAGADVEPDVQSGCQSTTYPPPPETGDEGGLIDFTVAVKSINLGEGGDKKDPVGLDIDNICTCLGEGASCKYPSYAATADHCDDKGGVDNSASRLFASIAAAAGPTRFGSEFYSQKADEGTWTLLLRVSGYNGMENDPKVKLAIYSPAGLESSTMDGSTGAGGGGGSDGAGGASSGPCLSDGGGPVEPQPCWNGKDVWQVSEGSVGGPGGTIDTPLFVDNNAYVSGGVLVANVSDTILNLSGKTSYIGIKVTAGIILASLQNPAGDNLGWRIANGTLAGRWRTVDLFETLSTFQAEGETLCTDNPVGYKIFKKRICESVDIASKLGGPTLECDAISFAMRFFTLPVKLGMVTATAEPMKQCKPDVDPAMDSCDKE